MTPVGVQPIVRLQQVGVVVDRNPLLTGVDLELAPREHLIVLGPNGAGKTTLLHLLAAYRHPTHGVAEVLGAQFGRADLRQLKRRVGYVSAALEPLVQPRSDVLTLVAAAAYGATWASRDHRDDPAVVSAAAHALDQVGAGHLAGRRFATLSQGEGQRVRIARCLVGPADALRPGRGPELILLDEPFAGLDLGARESLLADLDRLLADPTGPTVVLVTHHLEEVPRGIRSALLLRGGNVVAAGGAAHTLTSRNISTTFDLPIEVGHHRGRHTARIRCVDSDVG